MYCCMSPNIGFQIHPQLMGHTVKTGRERPSYKTMVAPNIYITACYELTHVRSPPYNCFAKAVHSRTKLRTANSLFVRLCLFRQLTLIALEQENKYKFLRNPFLLIYTLNKKLVIWVLRVRRY